MSIRLAARVAAMLAVCAAATYVGRLGLQAAGQARPDLEAATRARQSPTRPTYATHELLDRYAAGDHDAAIAGVDRQTTAGALRAAAERWIQAGDAATLARRQRVAAAFTLETVWTAAAHHSADVSRYSGHWDTGWRPPNSTLWNAPLSEVRAVVPIVAWGCHVIHSSAAAHHADASWDLASVAVLQQADAAAALIDWRPVSESPRLTDALVLRERTTGHLAHARARSPDDPRWRMAEALALAHRDDTHVHLHRRGVLRHRPGNPSALPRMASRFEALSDDPALAGEARLRAAHVELRRRRWKDALMQVERARPELSERFLAAVADYFSGWALEQMGRRDDAIAAYRRALSASPHSRNVSTLLAAQLFLANERTEAYAVLDAAFKVEPEPIDLVVQFERGDGRFVSEYVARLREALR